MFLNEFWRRLLNYKSVFYDQDWMCGLMNNWIKNKYQGFKLNKDNLNVYT